MFVGMYVDLTTSVPVSTANEMFTIGTGFMALLLLFELRGRAVL